jgi:3-methyladenine DNA glycosylase AlkD
MDIDATVRALRRGLAKQGSPQRARAEQRYLKSELTFLGVGMPVLRREAKALARAQLSLDARSLRRLVEALWTTRVHELRCVAIGLLEQRTDLLRARDAAWLIGLVRDAKTWAHVDWLATKVLGALVAREAALGKRLERWATDPDFWVRRSALLALHDPLLQGAGDFEQFARLARPLLHEREFFIRKAIGWVLRSAARRRPERTYGFVKQHARELSGLTFREATRLLPARQRKELAALRAAHADEPGKR